MENGLITDRVFCGFKKVLVVVILAALLFCLWSCEEKEKDDTYEEILSSISSALEEDADKIEKYQVIVAKGCSSEIYEAAKCICDKIKDKTGVYSELCYDSDGVSNSTKVCCVLVGKSKYTDGFLMDYKVNDFGYCYVEGTVFVGGISEEATLKAISKFYGDILERDGKTLIKKSDSFYSKGEYEMGYVELNGVELGKYVIAYDPNNKAAYSEALSLRDEISERTGYYLNIIKGNSSLGQSKAICVGKSVLNDADNAKCAENEVKIIPYTNGISILSDTQYGLSLGISKFKDILFEADLSGENYLSIDQTMHLSFSALPVEIFDIDFTGSAMELDEMKDLLYMMRSRGSDFIRVVGANETLIKNLSNYCSGVYEVNKVGDGDNAVYYFYLTEKYSLESALNKGSGELEATHFVYASKLSTVKIDILEISASERESKELAAEAAKLLEGLLRDRKIKMLMIASPFEGAAENLFADEIAPISCVSALCGAPELLWHRVYLAGEAFDIADCRAEKCYTTQLYFKNIMIYWE